MTTRLQAEQEKNLIFPIPQKFKLFKPFKLFKFFTVIGHFTLVIRPGRGRPYP